MRLEERNELERSALRHTALHNAFYRRVTMFLDKSEKL